MAGANVIHRNEARLPALVAREDWWPQFLADLRVTAGAEAWEHWLKSIQPCEPFLSEDGIARISVATAFLKSWIEKHYAEVVISAAHAQGFLVQRLEVLSRSTRHMPVEKVEKLAPDCEKLTAPQVAPNASIHFLPSPPQEAPGENAIPIIYDEREPLNEMLALLPEDYAVMCEAMITEHLNREGVLPARMAVLHWLGKQEDVISTNFNVLNVKVSRLPTARAIIDIIARDRNSDPEEICGKVRSRNLVLSRHLCISIIRRLTKLSLPLIGKIVGGRDHTTAMYACTQIAKRCEEEAEWRQMTLRHEYEIDRAAWLQGKPSFTNVAIEPDWEICAVIPSGEPLVSTQNETAVEPEALTPSAAANDDVLNAEEMPQIILGGKPSRKRSSHPLQIDMFAMFDHPQVQHG